MSRAAVLLQILSFIGPDSEKKSIFDKDFPIKYVPMLSAIISILRGILKSIFSAVMTHNLTLLDSTKYTDIIIYINAWLKWEQPGLRGRGSHLILIFEVRWLTLSTTRHVQNYRHLSDTEFTNHMLPWLTQGFIKTLSCLVLIRLSWQMTNQLSVIFA